MNWNKDKSIALSRVCVIIFAILLAGVDIGAYWICTWFFEMSILNGGLLQGYLLLTTIYSSSVCAWALLRALAKLLKNLQAGSVFVADNVRYLRVTSWCCAGICGIYFASAFYYVPMVLVSIAAGFIALIVRIVKNVFEQANAMKNELDLTV